MVKRIVVGAHYGLRDWLIQRVSAVVMALYTLLFVADPGRLRRRLTTARGRPCLPTKP